ncbi:MAG: hypothetical protein WC977_12435, partial [Anaerovoracaceae bacterium]
MSFNWTQVPVRLLRRNAYDVAMKEYERQVTEEVSAKNRQAQIAAVAPNRGWMHHISSENNKADAYRIAWEITMQKLQQQERQREWDAQAQAGQFWGDMQQKAQANLAKDSLLMGMSEPDRQRKIAEETYKLASQQFQAAGDYESAEESERRMRIAQGLEAASEQDYQTGVVRQVEPTAEQIAARQPQESRVKDFWDAVRVAVVGTAKSLAQSPATLAGTYIVGDQGEKTLAGIGAGAYAESYRRGETPQQMKERMAPLSDVDKRMLDTLGEYGAKIQTEYDDWYQSHPELWERPEYQKTPTDLWKTDKKTFLDPFYWGTKSVQSSIYTFGALVAGGLGYAMGGVTGAAIGAFAYTYPLMTQYS